VSDSWLERLVTDVAARRLPFYRALTSDGRITFEPSNPLDAAISRPLATTTVATRDLDPIRPGCRNTNNRNVRSLALFRREGRGRLGDEATRSGQLAALLDG
jgi:hypothetical protein